MSIEFRSELRSAPGSRPLQIPVTEGKLLTIPDSVASQFAGVETFELRVENRMIVLTPIETSSADVVRQELAGRNITEDDIVEAIEWARSGGH